MIFFLYFSAERKPSCDVESHQSSHHEHGDSKPHETTSSPNILVKVYKGFLKVMNLGLLKDPIFVLFAVSDFATSLGYYVPYFIIVDHATELGIPKEEASHLLSIIGIVNTVSRIVWGYVSDKSWVNRLWVYNICLTICGVGKIAYNFWKKKNISILKIDIMSIHLATVASVFCFDFKTLAIYSAVFGYTIGGYVALRSVILVDLMGLDKLNNSFGLLMLFEGKKLKK